MRRDLKETLKKIKEWTHGWIYEKNVIIIGAHRDVSKCAKNGLPASQ